MWPRGGGTTVHPEAPRIGWFRRTRKASSVFRKDTDTSPALRSHRGLTATAVPRGLIILIAGIPVGWIRALYLEWIVEAPITRRFDGSDGPDELLFRWSFCINTHPAVNRAVNRATNSTAESSMISGWVLVPMCKAVDRIE